MCGVVMRSHHSIRVPDDLWQAVKAKAKANYVSVSAVIIEALKAYLKD